MVNKILVNLSKWLTFNFEVFINFHLKSIIQTGVITIEIFIKIK